MKLATVSVEGVTRCGAIVDGGLIDITRRFGVEDLPALFAMDLLGDVAAYCRSAEPDFPLSRLKFLPVIARLDMRLFALGWAYKDHQVETGKEAPAYPNMFSKHPQSLVGHEEAVVRPRVSDKFDYEGEIVLIIGKGGRHIPPATANEHIVGYSILLDGSIRDWQKHSLTAGKNFDASSSFGPWLVTRDELPNPKEIVLTTRLNGNEMQRSSFGLMAWEPSYLVSYVSTFSELRPGDAISTGTPGGVGSRRTPPVFMKPGDRIEVEVTGIGTLRNRVIDES